LGSDEPKFKLEPPKPLLVAPLPKLSPLLVLVLVFSPLPKFRPPVAPVAPVAAPKLNDVGFVEGFELAAGVLVRFRPLL